MKQNRFAHEPLLYIHQPKIKVPEVSMQDQYMTDHSPYEDLPVATANVNASVEKQLDDDVPFKDMSIQDKIHYFLNRSELLPKIKCEVDTKDHSYHGIITDFKDHVVYMRTGQRLVVTKEIAFDDITNINMIGFHVV